MPDADETRRLVFAMPGFERLAPDADVTEPGRIAVERFANGELRVRLGCDVQGRDCLLVGSVSPPDSNLVELLLASDTLHRHGAADVHALLPYLGYARQDRLETRESLGAAWVGAQLWAAGVAHVVTVDIHSADAREQLGIPLASLSPARLFAEAVGPDTAADAVVVAPDEGALGRCAAFAREIGVSAPVAWLEKVRDGRGIRHVAVRGELASRAIVVDDILDTGATLVSCCAELSRRGVTETAVAVTHGLFTGAGWEALFDHGVLAIHTTDSVPDAVRRASRRVRVHGLRPLLETAVMESDA